MFIEQITLQNIKSYGSTPTTIYFKQGINLIAGANGAGKSTILEAIGFVLFDALPYSQGDFVRRGKSGATKVTIRLHSTYDNRVYDVERAIPVRYKVINVQDQIDEGIQSKDDLLEWLCQHLKVENQDDLKALFLNAVGVQQGTITSVFLSIPSSRKEIFDALLRVHDFKRASDQLNETRKYIADLLNENAKLIAKKEGQTERLSVLEEQIEANRGFIAYKEDMLTRTSSELNVLKSKLERLDKQKSEVDKLHQQIKQVNARIEHLQKLISDAQSDYNRSREAHEVVTANVEAYCLHEAAVKHLKTLEDKRTERDSLLENRREVEKQIESIKQQIKQLETQLAEVERAKAQLEKLSPLFQRQEQVETERSQLIEHQKERDRLQEQMTKNVQERGKLVTELQELHEKVERRQQLSVQSEIIRQEKERIDTEIEECNQRSSSLEVSVGSFNQAYNDATTQFERYQKLQEAIKQQEATLEKAKADRQQIDSELAQREELDAQLGVLGDQIIQANAQKMVAENNLSRISRELTELEQLRDMVGAEGAVCPVCRRDMDGQSHDEAMAYYNEQERKLHADQEQSQAMITQMETSLKGWQSQKVSLEQERDVFANQAALKTNQDGIADIEDKIVYLQASLSKLVEVPRIYADAENALSDARTELDEHSRHLDELKAELIKKVKSISQLNEQVAALPSQDELARREGEQETLTDNISQAKSRLNELTDIDTEVQRLENELTRLDNPREKQAVARSTVEKHASLENEYHEAQETLTTIQSELESAQERLQPYASLDSELESAHSQRDDTTDGYQLYIKNKAFADLLEEREKRLTDLRNELAEEDENRNTLIQLHNELAEDFDAEQYTRAKEEYPQLEKQQTELGADIRHLKSQLEEKENEINKLRSIVAEIEDLRTEAKRIEKEQQIFDFVRRSIRDAGPRIRKRKVQLVSEVAANYFSEIINDFTMRLHWDADDYGIYIEQTGEARPFNVLSGGEQMIAALSVRLALLTHMTRIRLIFLDEPTINLDENRRIQLAERLNQIDGLQQLFVISHDDTFISGSNHVIHVIKENGTSRVEMSHAAVY